EFSELAHQLEEVLRPEVAARSRCALAEIVLIAADTFSSMLSAYRNNLQPPASAELRHQIHSLTRSPSAAPAPSCKAALFGANTSSGRSLMLSAAAKAFTTWRSALTHTAPCVERPCS